VEFIKSINLSVKGRNDLKFKKSTNVLLSVLLAGSTFAAPAFANDNPDAVSNQTLTSGFNKEEILKKIQKSKQLVMSPSYDLNEKVRIIVEVAGETPIEYATKNEVLYQDLPQATKDKLQDAAESKQGAVQDAIKNKGLHIEVENSFTTVVNGFSTEVMYKDIATIEELPNVAKVEIVTEYERPKTEPNMTTSHGYIQTSQTWADAKYKGEGQIIAVLDTGVDPSHKDFVLSPETEEDLTAGEVAEIAAAKGLPGTFRTEKVPYGYNYFDKNQEILDLGPQASEHGMHVAGTTAANGEIKGVAPEAQVLGMKVFSNDPEYPSTYSDIYIAAMDDAIELGADVVNMSLSATSDFYRPGNLDDVAVTRASDNGIVVNAAASNAGHIGYGWDSPYAENPDIGTTGSPALTKDAISVAATGNDMFLYEHQFTLGANTFTGYGADSWKALNDAGIEIVSLGGKLGYPEDYAGKDVAGKIVLVKRGDLTFYDKNVNATAAGAAGIIVYNNGNPVFHKDQGGWGLVPFMLVETNVGAALEAAITTAGGTLSLPVTESKKNEGPEMGKMTEFSSWGTTPSLELKPEISAPGGNILSTMQNNTYGYMSGTSMATPHLAGGSALVIQYLKDKYPNLTPGERTRQAKLLLMNSARKIEDAYGQPFSPRRQGAGMMQTYAAVTTPVTVVNKLTNQGKVELKDFTSKTFSMTLVAKNNSATDVTYDVNTDVLTDTIQGDYNALIAGDMDGAVVTAPETITVPANGTQEFTVSVDLTNATIPALDDNDNPTTLPLKEDIFVEGFVTLEHASLPDLNVPYVGFYGEWDRPNLFDGFWGSADSSFYGWADMMDDATNWLLQSPKGYAISPNGDWSSDDIQPLMGFLRNAKEVQYNILDATGKELRRVKTEYNVVKTFFDGGDGYPYDYRGGRTWDATVKGATVPDGQYLYEVKGVIDYPGAQWQSKKLPVIVDTVAPTVDVTHDEATNTINWTAADEGSGIVAYDVLVNGESILPLDEDDLPTVLPGDATSYVLPEQYENSFVTVVAVDYALNLGWGEKVVGDNEIPIITLLSPAPLGYENSTEVSIFGLLEDGTGVKSLTVNGSPVEVQYDAETKTHYFETVIDFGAEGVHSVNVVATDFNDNTIGINREIFIDTTPATITVNSEVPEYVAHDVASYDLDVTLTDNWREMSFYIDDNHRYGNAFDVPFAMDGHTYNYKETLPLQTGLNTFQLALVDLGGHVTYETINIYKLAEGEAVPAANITSATVTPDEFISINRPAYLNATSDEAITWNVTVTDPEGNEVQMGTTEPSTAYHGAFAVDQTALNGVYTVTFGGTNAAGQEVGNVVKHFTVYNYATLISSVQTLNAAGQAQSTFTANSTVNIKASVKNLESFNVSPMVILQVLDSQNRVVGKSFLTMDQLNSQSTNGLGFQLPLSGFATGTYKVEAYVWTGWDMVPLAAASKGQVTFNVQ
jgi:lactocepin